ncbi:hypothetical protein [Dehalobacterium formicoaceticum]|uniref:hypothetical protein n=1 Tax=Dehalobacterium formicoaceticum TaxID=51515 RepID=UPI000B7CAAFD|nr:hypothetical protein [Dehalobacterium formicoaceticum]
MLKKCKIFSLFLLMFMILSDTVTYAEENVSGSVPEKREQKVVLVLIDYLTLGDLESGEMTTLGRMIREGGLGLMNANTAGGRVRAHSMVTIGAGRVALGSDDSGLALLPEEEYLDQAAGDVYYRRTGQKAPAPGQESNLLHLDIAAIQRNFAANNSVGLPGLLGETLHQDGLSTAYIGGADQKTNEGLNYRRHGATVAMDREGRVDFALVGEQFLEKKERSIFPDGDNYDALGGALSAALTAADFIVLETGDTVRLMAEKEKVREEVFQENKKTILKELDLFLADVLVRTEPYETMVLVVTPTPSRTGIQEKNLVTPLLLWQKGGPSGFLTSGTTRREGIVANTDIAPTVLDFFHIPVPDEMNGRRITILPESSGQQVPSDSTVYSGIKQGSNGTVPVLTKLNEEMVFVNLYRPLLVKGYVLGQIIFVLGAVVTLLMNQGKHQPGVKVTTKTPKFFFVQSLIKVSLLALSAVPLTLLIMGAYPGPSLGVFVALALICTFLLTALALRTAKIHPLAPFCFLSGLTAAAILLDSLWGSPLMQGSVLGYDPMGGSRYYGVGNEYMGVWLGAAMIAMATLLEISRRKKAAFIFSLCFFALITFILASPRLGTNAGGSLAALVGFGVLIYLLCPKKISRQRFLLLGGILLALLFGFALWDAGQSVSQQSHFGRTIHALRTNGLSEAYDIIVRKSAMNLKLIRWTIWSRVFLVILAATVFLFYRPVGVMKKAMAQYPYLAKGFWGVVAGSIAALILNDSGIVAAATMSIFLAAPLIFVVMKEQESSR